jgi:hypothetical protein
MHIFYKISFLINCLWACVGLFKPFVEVSSRRSVEQTPRILRLCNFKSANQNSSGNFAKIAQFLYSG